MATRVVEGKKPYTGGKAISIDENKVISLNLRDENNLIIYDAGDDEIYVDLQLDDEITPTSAFPIGVNVGRVIVDNGWDKAGTIISAETTSGDNIKIFYADEGTLWIDNGTGTFKQIYFKSDVDALLLALRNYIDGELAKKQNGVSSDTAPENPSEGDLWYDTTNDQLKVYDGTNWNVTGKEYNAGPGIGIGTVHSDMQGPAPDGFHVPSRNEWITLFETLITTFSMARDATTIGTYLKMPLAGNRNYSSSNVGDQGRIGYYWSSTPYSTNRAYYLEAYSSSLYRQNMGVRGYAHSVRCFKDTPVAPDSSWTMLYDGSSIATGAGVYYNSSLGLISVSGDGQNWLTIADKNLGATTVYNNGDTLSEANCGGYYQRGNNYMFPFTGIVTTSSTQVDASNYGPGNYYNSSTFITVNDWSSVQNDNLWGGVSQGTWTSGEGNTIVNTGVLSVNGQTGDISNVVTGDGQYVINVSTTAPASGTANSVITFVTD